MQHFPWLSPAPLAAVTHRGMGPASMTMTPKAPLLGGFTAALVGMGVAEWLPALGPTFWQLSLLGALRLLWCNLRRGRGTVVSCLAVCATAFGLRAAHTVTPKFPNNLCQSAIAGRYRAIVDAPVGRVPRAVSRAPASKDLSRVHDPWRDTLFGSVPTAPEPLPLDDALARPEPSALESIPAALGLLSSDHASSRLGPSALQGIFAALDQRRAESGFAALDQRTVVQLVAEACDGTWVPREGRVSVTLPPGAVLGLGDEIEVAMRVMPLSAPRAPGRPDAATVGRRQQLAAVGRNVLTYAIVRRATGPGAALERWRQRTAAAFEAVLPARTAPLAKALALGDQAGIALDQRQAWADAGTAQLLSVSGLHVALVAVLLMALCRRFAALLPGAGERFAVDRLSTAMAICGVVTYGLVTGGSAAALRATFMASALLAGRCIQRTGVATNALGLAGLLLLAASPMVVYDPGFWLSFVAVGALLALPHTPMPTERWPRLWASLRLGFLVSCAATLATAPLTAYFFGRVAFMAPLTNLVAAPVGSYVATPLALLFALVAPLAGPARAVGWALHWVLWGLDALARWVATWPWAAMTLPKPGLWAAGTLLVQHLYVGQGDATLVRFPQGEVMLVDGGGAVWSGASDPGQRAVLPALQALGVNHIDVLVATHPHPDHINGLVAVADSLPVREFWYNGTGAAIPAMGHIIARVRATGGKVLPATAVPASQWRQGVHIERLHPGVTVDPTMSANDNSLVLRLQYGARSIVLCGDVEAASEVRLAANLKPTDIVKVPHHGSRTSSTWPLLQAARPRLAVVSLGDENKFGFPHREVVARYDAANVPLWRTDKEGQVSEETDGRVWRVRSTSGLRWELR